MNEIVIGAVTTLCILNVGTVPTFEMHIVGTPIFIIYFCQTIQIQTKKFIKFWGSYVVHFIRKDSPYVVHFECRNSPYVVHFKCRDCPYVESLRAGPPQ